MENYLLKNREKNWGSATKSPTRGECVNPPREHMTEWNPDAEIKVCKHLTTEKEMAGWHHRLDGHEFE